MGYSPPDKQQIFKYVPEDIFNQLDGTVSFSEQNPNVQIIIDEFFDSVNHIDNTWTNIAT